jgi:amino acid transporter
MSTLTKSIGPLPLIAMGAAGIIGTSWIYTNGEFFAAYGAGGEIFGLAIATLLASFIAMSYAEVASKFPRAFAVVNERRGTPVNALLFTLALCLGLGWLGEGARSPGSWIRGACTWGSPGS